MHAPSYRFDVAIEADLIEELARIQGYDSIPTSRPHGAMTILPEPERRADAVRASSLLVERGYHEAITFSFVDPDRQGVLDPGHAPIALANPISSDMAVMRTTLWTGLLTALGHNQRRQQPRVRLFETGLRFLQGDDGIIQEPMVAGVACGTADPEQWGEASRELDFFDAKADVEALLGLTGPTADLIFEPQKRPALHPGQSARIVRGDKEIGWLGSLSPQVAKTMGLKGRIQVFELSLAALGQGPAPEYTALSRYPAIRRDLAVVVDASLSAGDLCIAVREAAGGLLNDLQLFDMYVGKGIDSDRKSLALGLTLQHPSRTLKDDEVDRVVDDVVRMLRDELGADLRE